MRKFRYCVPAAIIILISVIFLRANIPQVPTGTWVSAAPLSMERTGATATLMPDGRVLIAGGKDAAGNALASVDLFNADGSVSAAPPMATPRYGHSAIFLMDGYVLVAGGHTTGGGISNTAELFDPLTNTWQTLTGTMTDGRADFTMSQLQDGDVLVTGGDNGSGPVSSVDKFSLVANSFQYFGTLASARKSHAAAVLTDGRVIITGGRGIASDGTTVIAVGSTEIYDPTSNSVSAGPSLNVPRFAHTATTLIDGTVLIAGGNDGTNDLASAEIYDPVAGTIAFSSASLAQARSGHTALLLPNNNNVLIAGGTSAGTDLASTELYQPWNRVFLPNAPMSTARAASVGSGLQTDGVALIGGGSNLSSTELYGFATVKTDQSDYPPGSTVNITGSGWVPGETVTLTLLESPLIDTHGPFAVVADANGNIADSSLVVDIKDQDVRFYLTASGSQSQARTTFTDAVSIGNVSVSGVQTPNPVSPGSTATYGTIAATSVDVKFNGSTNGTPCTATLGTTGLPSSASATFAPATLSSTSQQDLFSLLSINTTTALAPGTYAFTVKAVGSGGCSQAPTTNLNLIVVEPTTTSLGAASNPSTFGQSVLLTATVAQTVGPTTPNAGTVTFKDGAVTLGTGTLNASGLATLAVSNLTAGSHSLTASYAGTALFAASNSNTVSQTVNQASTTTTIARTAGPSPSVFGQSLTFTATVAAVAPGAGTPTGAVTFSDGVNSIGTAPLNGSGQASLTANSLAVGGHSITAVYNADSNFTGSASSVLSQTVNQASTTTTITNDTPDPSVVGQPVAVNFTVVPVAPGSGTPSGNVTVSDGLGDSCTATVAAGNCSITFLAVGAKTLSASYAGDTNFSTSTSATAPHTVNASATTTTITAHNPSPSLVNQAITVNFTVTANSPGSGTPTGNVTVSDGTGDTCTGTVAAGTCQLTPLTSGSKTLTASYATDGNFAASTSAGVSHNVNQAPSITSANSTTFTVGAAGTFSVTATGFPVPTFTESGALPNGVTLSSTGVLSGTPAANTGGTYPIVITASNGVSPNATQNFTLTVNQAPAITSANSATFIVSQAGSFTVTATGFPAPTFTETGALPSGVTLTSAGVLAGTPTVTGNFPITITASNGVTPSASQSFTLIVGQPPAITSANSATFELGTAGSFSVTTTGFPAPTFSETGALPSGITLNSSTGALSGTPAAGTVGSYPITIKASNGVGTDATQSFTLTVNKATASFTNLTASQSITFGTNSITLSGRVNAPPAAAGTVTITINGVSVSGIALNGNPNNFGPVTFSTAAIPAASTPYVITYSYSGDANSTTATDTSTTLTVNKASPTFSNLASHTITFGAASVTLTGTISASTGFPPTTESVSITINGSTTTTPIGANGAFSANFDTHLIPASTTPYAVTYSYAGDNNFSNTNNSTTTLTVNKSTSSTSLASSLNPSFSGQQVTFTAIVTVPAGVPTGTVQFQDGGVNLGSAVALSNNGGVFTAQLQTSSLTVATHNITAIYNGDTNFSGSTSNTIAQVVKSADTTTSIGAPTITFGQNGLVTVTVVANDPSAGTPTGSVSLSVDGGSPLSQVLVNGSTQFSIPGLNAGDHSLSASYAAQNNFNASNATGTLHVNQAQASLSFGTLTFTYDGSPKAVTVTTTPANLSAVSITYSSGSAPTDAGSYSVSASLNNPNYIATPISSTETINPAQATLSFDTLSFTYDGTPKPVAVTTSPLGLSTVSVTYDGSPTAPTNAGSYAVAASLTNSNYTATPISGTEVIQQAHVSITVTDPNVTYDGNPHSAVIGVQPNVQVVVTYNGSSTAPTNAGGYNVLVTVTDTNYTGTGSGTLTINKASPTISWSNPADISYGTALSGTQLNATATFNNNTVPGTFTYNPATGTVLGAGDGQTLSADFAPSDSTDFKSVLGTTVLINVKTDPLYVISSDGSRAYGAANPTFSPTLIGLVNGDTSGSVGAPTCSSSANPTSTPGTYATTCSGVTSANYNVRYISGTLTVTNPLALITAVKDKNGDTNETLEIGQTDQLTAFGQFMDGTARALSVAGGSSFTKADLSPTSGTAVAEAGGVLYAIGGFDGTNTVGTIQAYDPKNDSWTVLPNNIALATPRKNAAVTSFAGKVYVIGGTDATSSALSSIEVLDTTGANPTISTFAGSLTASRSGAAAAVLNQKLYVIGGSDASNNALSSVEIFDLVTGSTSAADEGTSLAQASAAVVTNNSGTKLFVAGTHNSSVVLLGFDGTSWSGPVASSLDASKDVGAVSFNGLLYLVNGANVWSYDGSTFTPKSSLANEHDGTQPVSIGSLIYVASGAGVPSSKLDGFAPDEVNWTTGDSSKATIDESGNLTAIGRTDPGTVTLTSTSLTDNNVSNSFLLTVIRKSQTIQLAKPADKSYGDPDFSVSATSVDSTSNPTNLLVTFSAGVADGCTVGTSSISAGISSATVHITGAGTCTITASQVGDSATWAPAAGVSQSFQIAKAIPTVAISFATSPITYDGDPHAATVVVTGVNSNVLAAADGTVIVSYTKGASAFAGTPTDADGYTASAHFTASNPNYTDADSTVAASLLINKADPVVTAVGGTFTYDGTAHAGSGSATGVKGENLTPVNVAYKDSSNNLLTSAPANAGSYSVAVRYAGSANYNQKQSAPASLIINQADANITVNGYTGVYDGNAHGATGSAKGVEATPADLTSLLHLGSSFTNVPGGTANWTFDGNTNYKPASGSVVITIAQADANITVNGYTGVYDGNAHGATGSAKGVEATPADLTSLLHLGSSFTNVPGGTANWTFDGNTNYKPASGSVVITIAQADANITVNGYTGVYDGNAHGATGSAKGVEATPADLTSLLHLGSSFTNVPGGTANWTFDGNTNYKPARGSVVMTINQANSATVVTVPGGVSYTYNGLTHPATVSVTGAGGLNMTPAPVYSCGHPPKDVADSGCTASYIFAGDGNHLPSSDSKTYSISSAQLTVTADSKTMVLHAPVPSLTFQITGFKNGETATVLTTQPTCTSTGTSASGVGTYPITCSGGAAANYSFNYIAGQLSILYSTGACLGDLGHQVLQPINATGTMSVFKLGSTVPTKFRVCDANGVSIGTAGLVTGYGLVAAANTPNITVDEDVYSTTPDTAFRWTGDQWIFNQSTKNNSSLNKTGVTYYFTINLNDGSSIYFQYALK